MSKKKKDPKYDSELEKTVFSWGIMATDVTIANVMKKKARGGYDQRYVVLSHILYYKPATKEGTPLKYDLPRGVINLRRVQYDEVRIDADTSSIVIPTAKRVFEFKSPEDKVLSKWVRVVKERSEVVVKTNIDELVNFQSDIQTVQNAFPKSFNMTPRTKVEYIDKIIEDRTKCGNELKKWDPYMRKAALFLECYFGQNRNYIDWFVGSDGPSRILQNTEEEMLSSWKTEIEKAMKAAPETATLRFFKEDMEETAQLCEQAVMCIDGINKYSRLFINPDAYVDEYTREKEMLQKFATTFRAFPSERSVDYRTHRGGVVKGANGEEYNFSIAGGMVSLKGQCMDANLHFSAQGPELLSMNQQYGTVVWNTRTWVWYHSRYPHTIRFDLDAKSGTFRFRPSPSQSGKNEGYNYCDWSWAGGKLSVINNNSKDGKIAPKCGEWKMEGDVPVAAVLLAGMSDIIVRNSNSV